MKIQDYKMLKIMEALHDEGHISQRSLSEKLEMSLGLVNSFVKHLTAKGYFVAKSLPKRRVRYILTPEGAAEKTKLIYDYVRHSFDTYKKSYGRIHDMVKSLVETEISSVVFYGVSNITDMTFQALEPTGIEVNGVYDDFNKGRIVHGYIVDGLDYIHDSLFDKVIVTACDNDRYSIAKLIASEIHLKDIVTI